VKSLFQKNIVILFSFALLLISCKKNKENSNCLSYTNAAVTNIAGPNTAFVNQEIVLTISFQCTNGCGQFGSFEETSLGNNINVTVKAKYEGCICTQDIPIRTTQYKFKKSQSGSFQLRFLQSNNSYLSHTIVVQ
jgi:hypothetical protein